MAGAEYPRQVRLLNSAQFKAVFDDSRFRASTRELLVLARPNHPAERAHEPLAAHEPTPLVNDSRNRAASAANVRHPSSSLALYPGVARVACAPSTSRFHTSSDG